MPRRGDNFDQRDAQDLARVFFKLPRQAQIALLVLAVIAGIVFWVIQHHRTAAPSSPDAVGDLSDTLAENLFLGNPSAATGSFLNRDNYLLDKTYYALSYNNAAGEANWVSWRLTRADLGSTPRKAEFDPDVSLPATFKQITSRDYSGSGFDRGHLCPHGDREASLVQSDSTFCMTNIVPQSHPINEGIWGQEEDYLRRQVRSGHRLYIVAGPAGQGGSGAGGSRALIANGKVIVPKNVWKVAVIVNETGGPDRLASITARTRVVAVMMPNESSAAGGSWARFRVRPSEIEQQTRLHFFSNLSAEVRQSLDDQLDSQTVE